VEIMNNINELTSEQLQELLELSRRLKEQDLRENQSEEFFLPEEIYEELENSSKTDLKNNLRRFARDSIRFDGGNWTRSGTVNKIYLPELKKFQVDAAQTVNAFSKGADRMRTAGRGATEIFQNLQSIIPKIGKSPEMETILEKARRLAVYSLATGKEFDQDAKELSTKALRLPEALKYLEDEDEEDRDYFFPADVVEKIQQTRHEQSITKAASFQRNQVRGGRNYRGNVYRGRPGRGSFFGRGRSKNTTFPRNSNTSTTNNSDPRTE
jgi:hypothetical protein